MVSRVILCKYLPRKSKNFIIMYIGQLYVSALSPSQVTLDLERERQ